MYWVDFVVMLFTLSFAVILLICAVMMQSMYSLKQVLWFQQFRSSGEKSIKEEALDSLKAMGSGSVKAKEDSASPVQALLGGISAGVIALILYKFATTIEAGLNRQTISDNFSVCLVSCPSLICIYSFLLHGMLFGIRKFRFFY